MKHACLQLNLLKGVFNLIRGA